MRLNAWLARAGVASRRKSDELIKAGRVSVNGAPAQLNTDVPPTGGILRKLADGVRLPDDETKTAPAQVRRISGSVVELTIHEGRNHQVKRMFESVGHRVKRLHRSRYANLSVEDLEPGAWRE